MKHLIRGSGFLSAVLAVFHAAFWRLFDCLREASALVFGNIATGESQFFFALTLVMGLFFTSPLLRYRTLRP